MASGRAPFDVNALSALTTRGTIPFAAVDAVSRLIDESGIAEQIATWRNEDRPDRHPGGRPAAINDRAVLSLLLLLGLDTSPLFISRAADLITSQLSPESLEALDIRQHPADGADWYDRCWRALHRLMSVIDPYPGPRRQRTTDADYAIIVANRDQAEQAIKQQRLDWVANELIHATRKLIPRDVRRRWKGNIAIDATPVKAFARPRTTRSPETIEPDAAWYVRTGDHRDPGDQKGRTIDKMLFGYEAHFAIATPNNTTAPSEFPLLVRALAFDKPGHNIGENAITLQSALHDRKRPAGLLTADRAYLPNSHPTKLQLPAKALGYGFINDYRDDQLGVKEGHAGAIHVEGSWYCPSMPQPLIDATIDLRAGRIDEATYSTRIAERTRYLLRAKERPDQHGTQPLRCPAVGHSATVACPLRPKSSEPTKVHLRARVFTPPAHPDRICTQTSVSFPATVGIKYGQELQFGSDEWHSMYATARNTIEGFNGFIKDGPNEALADPTRRRIRGRTAHHLMTAVLVVAANIRKIRTWLAEQAAQSITQRPTRRRTKTAASLTTYLPTSGVPPGVETRSA